MKILPALLGWLALGVMGHAQSAAPGSSVKPLSAAAKNAADKAPGKKAEPPSAEEPATIEGMEVSRGERGFMGVQIVNGTFKIAFYDAKKKLIAPDVVRAALWWDPKYKVGRERVVLNLSGDGKSLSSPRAIRPPYNFKLFITLIKESTEAEDAAGETHVIDFRA